MFDSLQYYSTRCALQYEIKTFVTTATFWVPDLPDVKGFSGHLGVPIWYLPMAPHLHDLACGAAGLVTKFSI